MDSESLGVIRVQDVRATEKDKVKMGDCFRGGDVVRGVVVSSMTRSFRKDGLIWVLDIIGRRQKLLFDYWKE